jgi:hypothetical protein
MGWQIPNGIQRAASLISQLTFHATNKAALTTTDVTIQNDNSSRPKKEFLVNGWGIDPLKGVSTLIINNNWTVKTWIFNKYRQAKLV